MVMHFKSGVNDKRQDSVIMILIAFGFLDELGRSRAFLMQNGIDLFLAIHWVERCEIGCSTQEGRGTFSQSIVLRRAFPSASCQMFTLLANKFHLHVGL